MKRLLSLLLVAGALACQPDTSQDINTAQALQDLGDGINALRMDNAEFQNQLDSLRLVIAKQDTVLRRLANLAGMPIQ
jgi:hypothetical protein